MLVLLLMMMMQRKECDGRLVPFAAGVAATDNLIVA